MNLTTHEKGSTVNLTTELPSTITVLGAGRALFAHCTCGWNSQWWSTHAQAQASGQRHLCRMQAS